MYSMAMPLSLTMPVKRPMLSSFHSSKKLDLSCSCLSSIRNWDKFSLWFFCDCIKVLRSSSYVCAKATTGSRAATSSQYMIVPRFFMWYPPFRCIGNVWNFKNTLTLTFIKRNSRLSHSHFTLLKHIVSFFRLSLCFKGLLPKMICTPNTGLPVLGVFARSTVNRRWCSRLYTISKQQFSCVF